METEKNVREELQRFYNNYGSLGRKPANIPNKPMPQKKWSLGRKAAKAAYWLLIAGALAYAGLETFCDRLNSETLKEKRVYKNGVVWVREQHRMINPLTLYRVTAFSGDNAVYDSVSPLEPLVPEYIKRAEKKLRLLESL